MERGLKNITNFAPVSQADRIKLIEQKLQHITDSKLVQQREDSMNISNQRINNLQDIWNGMCGRMEINVKEHKDILKELNKEYEEKRTEQDISLRNRSIELSELQNILTCIWRNQLQRAKDNERRVIVHYEQKLQNLKISVQKQIQKRKAFFMHLDAKLSEKLPALQTDIALFLESSSKRLFALQSQIQNQNNLLCKDLKKSQTQKIESQEKLAKTMTEVIAQINEELKKEKQSRQASRKKLLSLFEAAYTKVTE